MPPDAGAGIGQDDGGHGISLAVRGCNITNITTARDFCSAPSLPLPSPPPSLRAGRSWTLERATG